MITGYDKVETLIEKSGTPIGLIGIIGSLYDEHPQGEVEIWDEYKVI